MTLYTLNILDLIFTLYARYNGIAEVNPFLQSVPFMIAYKVIVIGALCYWLDKQTTQFAKYGMAILIAVYTALDVWHILNLF